MEINVTQRHFKMADRFNRHLEEKLGKIETLAPRVDRVDVVVSHEANPRQTSESHRVEITCHDARTVVRAEAAADEEYAALDLAMAKLTERLRRLADKRKSSRTGKRMPTGEAASLLNATSAAAEPFPAALAPQQAPPTEEQQREQATDKLDREIGATGNPPVELREKEFTSQPMTVGQALTRMELVGHDFFLFHDVDADRPAVVYKRRGWSYGVIHLTVEGEPLPFLTDEPAAAGAGA